MTSTSDDLISIDSGLLVEKDQSELRSNYGHMSGFVPGLEFIRNQVIKPLLFATEKVFEQYITTSSTA